MPFGRVASQFLLAKARSGVSDGYLAQLRYTFDKFGQGRLSKPIQGITTADVEAWLVTQVWKPRTHLTQIRNLACLFNWAVRRGILERTPLAALDAPRIAPGESPAIHTAEQVRAVLRSAQRADAGVCRLLAIRYFAGLRTAEAERLEEGEIHLDRRFIEITASKAKTRRRRLVKIGDTLAAWLALPGELPADREGRVAQISRLAGVPWPRNVTRHSFCSYHLAHFGSASRTALEAGHSEAMLFAHYRELVTAEAAAEFWSLTPQSCA